MYVISEFSYRMRWPAIFRVVLAPQTSAHDSPLSTTRLYETGPRPPRSVRSPLCSKHILCCEHDCKHILYCKHDCKHSFFCKHDCKHLLYCKHDCKHLSTHNRVNTHNFNTQRVNTHNFNKHSWKLDCKHLVHWKYDRKHLFISTWQPCVDSYRTFIQLVHLDVFLRTTICLLSKTMY